MSKTRFAKVVLFVAVIVLASITFGGPALAAVKVGTVHLAQLAGSTESTVLALLGSVFLTVASAVRRLKPSAKESLS